MNGRPLSKNIVLFILVLLICLGAGCGKDTPKEEYTPPIIDAEELIDAGEPTNAEKNIDVVQSANAEEPGKDDGGSEAEQYVFDILGIPQYEGDPYVVLNENRPLFSEEDMTVSAFETYSDLDGLGRCGAAYANICKEIMPTDERGAIGYIKPSGWHTVKYNDLIDGNYLYNRCHLIGYRLAGENANEKNLITGTRYLNTVGMMPFENMVWNYVQETGNHVLYRVTPIFENHDLVACGVTMEAFSVEDKGTGICFYVYVYNVQPGIIIDYASGESRRDPAYNGDEAKEEPQVMPVPAETPEIADVYPEGSYVLNTNTHKFHLPTCPSVADMAEKNRQISTESREEIINQGYAPCKRCKP